MKKFSLFMLCGLFLMASLAFKSAGTGVWTLKKDQEGISVYTRKVSGSNILEFRGKVDVDAPLDRTITLFEDDSKVPLWFYHGSRATVVEQPDELSKVYYYIVKLPWPVSDRDTVFERTKSMDPSSGEITYTLKSLPDLLPRKKSIVRVIYLKSSWRFIPLPDGHTEIYFQQYSRPEGAIPSVMANHLAVDVPFYSLKSFRSLL